MSKLKEFIREAYADNPANTVRFVNRTVRLVKVAQHYWRGNRKITNSTVEVGGRAVDDSATTKPAWKLLPPVVASQFKNFGAAVSDVIATYCVSRSSKDDEALTFGDGVHAVDIALWPEADLMLRDLQTKWGEAADRWCTDDGYREFVDLVKEHVGPEYDTVKDLIPKAEALRRKFWLEVNTLPFRLVEDVGTKSDDEGRVAAVVELIEGAVKVPREEAAEVWSKVAAMMVETDTDGALKPVKPLRKNADGTHTVMARRVQYVSIVNAVKALVSLNRSARFHDQLMTQTIALIKSELPADKGPAAVLANKINTDDAEALRIGRILIHAAATALDEASMCSGVGQAVMTGGAA